MCFFICSLCLTTVIGRELLEIWLLEIGRATMWRLLWIHTIRYDTLRYDTIRYDKNSLNETNGTSWSDTHRYDTAFTGIFYTAHMLLPVRLQRLSVQMKAQLNYFASLSSRMARVDKHFTNRRRHTCEDILEPSLDVSLISVDWLHLVLL